MNYRINLRKEIVESLLAEEFISPINKADLIIIKNLRTSDPEGSYADSWAYFTQAAHMEELDYRYGLKYCDGTNFLVMGVFDRPANSDKRPHVHIIRPSVKCDPKLLLDLAKKATKFSGTPTYITKISINQFRELSLYGMEEVSDYPWHDSAPLEDDSFPEHIVILENIYKAVYEDAPNELQRKYNKISKKLSTNYKIVNYSEVYLNAAHNIVIEFFSDQYPSHQIISTPSDYINMLEMFNDEKAEIYSKLIFCDNDPVGLFIAEKTSHIDTVGIYANLVLYKKAQSLSEFMLVHFLLELYKKEYKYANLGGSEQEGLHDFKKKFTKDNKGFEHTMTWCVLPDNGSEINNYPNIDKSTSDFTQNEFSNRINRKESDNKTTGPQSQAILILINVVLGIALWQALVAFFNPLPDTSIFQRFSLFFIVIANLLRTFLGFVSFEINKGLADEVLRKLWTKESTQYRYRIEFYRTCDFILGMIAATLLIPLSIKCGHPNEFSQLFFIVSLLFVLRNARLWYIYNTTAEQLKINLDIPSYKHDYIIAPFKANFNIVRIWFWVDLWIFLFSLGFIYIVKTGSREFYGIIGFCIIVIMIWEIFYNSKYYFAGGVKES